MLIGTLDAIRRYPVKSLRGEALDSVEVGESGIPGDRAGALFVQSGHARVGKTYRGKEHDRLHLLTTVEAAHQAAAERGTHVELQRGEHFFDDAPISLLVDRWLEELSAHLGYAVEWERFRPNLFVRAAAEFQQTEDALTGAELQLGSVRLRVRYPDERCVTTTYHPDGKPSDPRVLRFVAQHRNTWMGIYCDVVTPGVVKVRDQVTLRLRSG
ncbi:MAG TPA: MOSC domain-containing protein [Candidatus Cybelea sp.]|jgi:hypothetical protein|nr:MOSC domain-containing protein [Candidatus Cybelea sp.]